MKICVQGLWHLGSVTAACVADAGFETVGLDDQANLVEDLKNGKPPIFEPRLEEVIRKGLSTGNLSFTTDPEVAVSDADIVWVTYDTPVDDDDVADTRFVKSQIGALFPYLRNKAVVLISSQLPVGSVSEMKRRFEKVAKGRVVYFACSPENLRLGKAIEVFQSPGRIVVGTDDRRAIEKLTPFLSKLCSNLLWMSVESAEMVKHALNAYLASSITFTNEVATICEKVGADASDIEKGLRSDPRIGQRAYVKAGTAFAGGTLARDIKFLNSLAKKHDLSVPLLSGVHPSNDFHRNWPMRKLKENFPDLSGKTVFVLGLSYKPGTDVTRRSIGIELCRWLKRERAVIRAFDPKVKTLPEDLQDVVELIDSADSAVDNADAVILATEWPEFKHLAINEKSLIIDSNGFLDFEPSPNYFTIGRAI